MATSVMRPLLGHACLPCTDLGLVWRLCKILMFMGVIGLRKGLGRVRIRDKFQSLCDVAALALQGDLQSEAPNSCQVLHSTISQ